MAKIGILGAGTIGRLVAQRLRKADQEVTLKGREPVQENDAELWLICTKSYQVKEAVAALSPPCDVPLVLLCNGLGPHQTLAGLVSNPLYLGTTTYGARKSEGVVEMTGRGQCWYGHYRGSKAQLGLVHRVLNLALPPAQCFENVLAPLWRKLAINAVINPLTARDKVANGALLADTYQAEITALVTEMLPVLAAEGQAFTKEALVAQILAVAEATAANTSSMLADRLAHRRTEIDAINGYLCQKAQMQGLSTPRHLALWQQITALGEH
ncbi:ketopantoate reductase family protein [Gallaecimonas pentaromativorans]|uniref:ketopantoate reductase family protein n=1 Tax=Gallaecimonas pentaromativorans TaxID=584787 RepID=UPI003A9310A6